MRFARIFLALSILASMALFPSAAGASTCWPLNLETFEVDATPRADVYRIGQSAVIDVSVTRKATGSPVEGATVFVGIDAGHDDGFLFGKARTDANGETSIKVRLYRGAANPGPATLYAYAYHRHIDTRLCEEVAEYGYEVEENAFRVKR
jgi:hypothetical protein